MRTGRACWHAWTAALAVLLVLAGGAPGAAQTGPDTMNFQGRLLDSSGNPVDTPRCMRFRLCSDAACAEPRWPVPDADFEHHLVTPEGDAFTAGLFTVALGSVHAIRPALLYGHDTLYLEMGVGPEADPCSALGPGDWDTLAPPSPLRVSAYAQRSRRVRTTEDDSAPLVEVVNTGSGGAVYGQTGSTASGTAAGEFLAAGATGQTYGVRATSANGIGVRGLAGSPSGPTPSAKVGVWGDAGSGIGVLGYTAGTSNTLAGVAGWATAASGQAYGVWGSTSSNSGVGVYGTGPRIGARGVGGSPSGSSPAGAIGVWGDSNAGTGLYGTAPITGTAGIATAGSGVTYGVYGRNATYAGAGVYGTSSQAGGTGVRGQSSAGAGVYGSSASGNGLEGASSTGNGVFGSASASGVEGLALAASGAAYGVHGATRSADGAGVYGESEHTWGAGVRGTSPSGYGVYGSSDAGYGVYSDGDAHVQGSLTWQAKTGYISIPPAAFQPSKNGLSFVNHGHTLEVDGGWDVRSHYYATVRLPHGATITRFTVHYYAGRTMDDPIDGPCPEPSPSPDDGICASGRIAILRTNFSGAGGMQSLVELREVATPYQGTRTVWTDSIALATIDNASYAYYVWAGLAGDAFWLRGVQIEYQFSEPY